MSVEPDRVSPHLREGVLAYECPACVTGPGVLRGLQWGSSEWPGCDVCAPASLATGGEGSRPFPQAAGYNIATVDGRRPNRTGSSPGTNLVPAIALSEHLYQTAVLEAENDANRYRLKAVAALHSPRKRLDAYGDCRSFCPECQQAWPCATAEAVAPEPDETEGLF